MPRAKSASRVKGPYSERGGARFRIRIGDETGQHDRYFVTLKEAQAAKRQTERELPKQGRGRLICDAIDAYFREQVNGGKCLEQTACTQKARLGGFLGDYLDQDFGKLTARRAAALYERVVRTPTLETGQPPSAATHRFYLGRSQPEELCRCRAMQCCFHGKQMLARMTPLVVALTGCVSPPEVRTPEQTAVG